MTQQPIRLHARTHDLGGSDPLGAGYIRYDYQNVGDYLQIETTGAAPTSEGILLYSAGDGNDIVLKSEGGIYENDVNGWGIVLQSTTGTGGAADVDLIADRDIVLNAGRDVDVQAANFLNLASLGTADLGASTQLQISSDSIRVDAGVNGIITAVTGTGNGGIEEDVFSDNNAGINMHVQGLNNGGIYNIVSDNGNSGIKLEVFGTGGLPIALYAVNGAGISLTNNGDGFGIIIDDNSSDGMQIEQSGSGGILVKDFGAGGISLNAAGTNGIQITTGGTNTIDIVNTGTGASGIRSTTGNAVTLLTTGTVIIGTGAISARLAASQSFTIATTAPTSLFDFKQDGTAFAYSLPTSNAGLAAGGIYRNGAGANVALMIV